MTASLVELSDHRPDDIAVIIGPHPLVRIRWLEHPIARVCEGPEILLAARHRCNRTDEFVWIGRLVQVHLVADQCHAPVGCRDPRDHRGELEVPVRDVHDHHPARPEFLEIERHRFAREQMDRYRIGGEGVDDDEVISAVGRVGQRESRVAKDDGDVRPAYP
jgi:hypothetical protein